MNAALWAACILAVTAAIFLYEKIWKG